MANKKYKQMIKQYRERYDWILEEYEIADFYEIIGCIGGDFEKVRIYPDGSVGMK